MFTNVQEPMMNGLFTTSYLKSFELSWQILPIFAIPYQFGQLRSQLWIVRAEELL
jgi:hypothetical protein